MEAIKTEGLSKTYVKGLRQRKVLALNNLSLTVVDGEIFGFLGPNGAGKSTTIKLLCDLIRPSSGRAIILGRDVREPAARRHIGYLPENPSYFGFLTAWELLEFHGKIHGMSAGPIRERGEELLAMLKLIHAAHGQVRTYSKGMVQRVGIAAALIHDPRILIFDEPMSGLDPPGRKLVADLMLEMRDRGKVVFFSTESFDSYEVLLRRAEQEQVAAMEQDGYAPVIFEDKIKVDVPKGDLVAFLASFVQNDMELISIEAKRFSLEDFFMGFVTTHPKE
jgi:ABC-2 type transport system ATP-binding protein